MMTAQQETQLEQDMSRAQTESIRRALRAALRREPTPREVRRFLAAFLKG